MYCTAPLSPRKRRLRSFRDDDDDDDENDDFLFLSFCLSVYLVLRVPFNNK